MATKNPIFHALYKDEILQFSELYDVLYLDNTIRWTNPYLAKLINTLS